MNGAAGVGIDWELTGLTEDRWRELAQGCGANERDLKFCVAIRSGATATGAARAAGVLGKENAIKQAAFRLRRSDAVIALLTMAAAEAGDTTGGVTERDIEMTIGRLVHARNNPTANKFGVELWERRQARKEERAAGEGDRDLKEILADMGTISPELAIECAVQHGVELELPKELRAAAEDRLEAVARQWIARHPHETVALVRSLHHVVGAVGAVGPAGNTGGTAA
jgi:hypothetical protein